MAVAQNQKVAAAESNIESNNMIEGESKQQISSMTQIEATKSGEIEQQKQQIIEFGNEQSSFGQNIHDSKEIPQTQQKVKEDAKIVLLSETGQQVSDETLNTQSNVLRS